MRHLNEEDSIVFARMVVYPILVFVMFLITILGGCFITGEMDPMAWSAGARAVALFVTFCLSTFGALAVEVNELPKIVAKTFRTPLK